MTGDAPVDVTDFWLTTASGSLGASWFWPAGEVRDDSIGVVLVPGLVHEEQTMAIGLVALARELAAAQVPTLLVDLAGTAQGSGTLGAPDIGRRWDDDVRSAVEHVREQGFAHVAVVGVRTGALLAAHALAHDPVDLLVMWAPVLSGRRFVRELQVMQSTAADPSAAVEDRAPGVTVAGFNLPPVVLDHLSSLDAARLAGKPAARLCLVDTAERLDAVDPDHRLLAGVPVDRLIADDTDAWLFTRSDLYPAPFEALPKMVRRITDTFVGTPEPSDVQSRPVRPDVSDRRSQIVEHDGALIRETFVEFGAEVFDEAGARLTGILSEPVGELDRSASYVAVTTAGPGRIFVDLARREAALGRVGLRFNLSGFGTSSRRPRDAWADYYHPAAPSEIGAAIDLLRSVGHDHVTVVGFCAGAWAALQMAPRRDLDDIVAINAQLMIRSRVPHRKVWPGMTMPRRILAKAGEHELFVRLVEKLEREHPLPSPAVRWSGRHVDAGTGVTLVYDDVDDGIHYIESRAYRPFGVRSPHRRPTIKPYAGLGHLPAGRARDRMLADLHSMA